MIFVAGATTAQAQPADDPYATAFETFRAAFETATDRDAALETAAMQLVAAVDGAPRDARAPAALMNAAVALETVGRRESAARVYSRIIDEVGPLVPTPENAESLDEILVNAYLRRARLRERAGERERALDDYVLVASSARFARSTLSVMAERIEEATLSAASLLAELGREREAARHFQRLAEGASRPSTRDIARQWLESRRPTGTR
ncbi:MAG: hypothetical protein R3B82_28790 [Sandaracinaceae bacterium]